MCYKIGVAAFAIPAFPQALAIAPDPGIPAEVREAMPAAYAQAIAATTPEEYEAAM